MTFHLISLCYSLSLCIFSSALCMSSEEKPGAQLLPTHLSFPLSLASTDEAAQLYLGGMYCISSILTYQRLSVIWHLDVLAQQVLYHDEYQYIKDALLSCTVNPGGDMNISAILYQWIKLCTMLNFKEGILIKLCDRFHLVGMMTERSYFWYVCGKNSGK